MKKSDLHWVAGILEGEGCFTPNRQGGRIYHLIQVTTADRDVLEKLVSICGGSISGPHKTRSPKHSPMFAWSRSSENASKIMEAIYDLMSDRRRKQIDYSFAEVKKSGKLVGSTKRCARRGCTNDFIVRSPTQKYCDEHLRLH